MARTDIAGETSLTTGSAARPPTTARPGAWSRRLPLCDPAFRAPVVLFAMLLALFLVERLFLALGAAGRLAGVPGRDLLAGFLVGLRYDLHGAALLALPLAPAAALSARLAAGRWTRRLTAGYCAAAAAFALVATITDYYCFRQFGERLNHRAVEYCFVGYAWRLVWQRFPVAIALTAGAAALAGLYLLFERAVLRRPDASWMAPVRWRLGWPVALAGLLALAVRGSLGPRPLNAGPAYFSPSPALTQFTLNGLFTLREAIERAVLPSREVDPDLGLLSEPEALAVAAQAIVRPGDRLVGDPENPLRRVTCTGRPRRDLNVVLVLMESCSWQFVGAMGGDPALSPRLDRLIGESVLMDRCFASGTRSPNGCAAVLGGFPDLPGRSASCRARSEGRFLTLAAVLRERGYETVFVSGGEPGDDHRRSFLGGNGYSRLVFGEQFRSRTFHGDVGLCDEDAFDQALAEMAAAGERPFLLTVVTSSFHPNFHFPAGKVEPVDPADAHHLEKDCQRYADWALGRFMDAARRLPTYDRTVFVLVADHGGHALPVEGFAGHRVPLAIHAPKILAPRRVSTVCSQTDVAPTVLSLLGGSYEHCFFGSSVLDRPPGAGWALMQHNSELGLLDADGTLVAVPCGAPPRLFRFGPPGRLERVPVDNPETARRREELRRRAVAVLQAASIVYGRDAFNLKRATGPTRR